MFEVETGSLRIRNQVEAEQEIPDIEITGGRCGQVTVLDNLPLRQVRMRLI
jgi:hypothetical protein